ncbi:class I SAM-dependent methyltransferase [Nocardioides conyzicola]|uniref:Methyltransferase type 11 domain-containing protein n=1 Tax=Nocardioides conyzicola TaxID=1651781 RepID=A0ABP8XWS8_9ACTN
MSRRALSFGAAAREYDRFRPGYPDELADLVLAHARGPVRRALEIGAGTGKATRLFAGRGVHVVAVEPDAEMRAVLLAQTVDLPVEVLAGTFEEVVLPDVGLMDLCFAGAAFHWTDPETRWQRVAASLRSGGVAAIFGAQTVVADPGLAAAITAIEEEITGPGSALLASAYVEAVDLPELEPPELAILPRRSEHAVEDYLGHLGTVSAYLLLEPRERAAVLARVRALLPARVELAQDVYVQLTRRV